MIGLVKASEPKGKSLEKSVFDRLRKRYLLAFVAIAASIIVSELFVQHYLNMQLSDSRVINLAGRQRMLSQKLSKEVLLLGRDNSREFRQSRAAEISDILDLWQQTHVGLIRGDEVLLLPGGNSPEVARTYEEIQPSFEKMVFHTGVILDQLSANPTASYEVLSPNVNAILASEPVFLEGMSRVVFLYDEEAREKVSKLKRVELFLLVFALAVLVFEISYIFLPTTHEIKRIIGNLIRSEEKARQNASEISGLYSALQKSHEDLAEINLALDQASIFAKADKNGEVFYISNKLTQLTGFSEEEMMTHITNFIPSALANKHFFEQAFWQASQGHVWHDQLSLKNKAGEVIWLDMTIVPVINANGKLLQLIVLCSDITEKKRADEYFRKLDKDRFVDQIREQRLRSSLILEGQEEERRRISKDIHDGIGQLLTGLKFQIEAVNVQDQERAAQKLSGLKDLVKETIAEVRRVSFFLAPGVLEDYGLASAVNNFVLETRKFSSAVISFNNITGFNARLEAGKEINLYRIIQEAVNNALKYAEAGKIKISFFHDAKRLTIIIQDDGKGFSFEEAMLPEREARGHGLGNMKERAMYIDGKIEILSRPGEGTKVYLQVPI